VGGCGEVGGCSRCIASIRATTRADVTVATCAIGRVWQRCTRRPRPSTDNRASRWSIGRVFPVRRTSWRYFSSCRRRTRPLASGSTGRHQPHDPQQVAAVAGLWLAVHARHSRRVGLCSTLIRFRTSVSPRRAPVAEVIAWRAHPQGLLHVLRGGLGSGGLLARLANPRPGGLATRFAGRLFGRWPQPASPGVVTRRAARRVSGCAGTRVVSALCASAFADLLGLLLSADSHQ
jgi:hypothetical protein